MDFIEVEEGQCVFVVVEVLCLVLIDDILCIVDVGLCDWVQNVDVVVFELLWILVFYVLKCVLSSESELLEFWEDEVDVQEWCIDIEYLFVVFG